MLVDDGSRDQTCRVIEAAATRLPGRIRTLCLAENSGKAEAIRQGILTMAQESDAQWLGYWDADLATPLDELHHLMEHAEEGVKMLMCSRVKRLGARIDRHAWRHVAGRCMATLISLALKIPVYDTQCGAKLLHRSVVHTAFDQPFSSRWLFDVEIISRIQGSADDHRILEIPITKWTDVPGSKLKFNHMFCSLIDIARIYLRNRFSKKSA